mgnify:CR=1 FL=1
MALFALPQSKSQQSCSNLPVKVQNWKASFNKNYFSTTFGFTEVRKSFKKTNMSGKCTWQKYIDLCFGFYKGVGGKNMKIVGILHRLEL